MKVTATEHDDGWRIWADGLMIHWFGEPMAIAQKLCESLEDQLAQVKEIERLKEPKDLFSNQG